MNRAVLPAIALSFGALLCASQAQNEPTKDPHKTNDPQGTQTRDDQNRDRMNDSASQTDAVLATWLAVDNQNEVELARLAQQKATSNEVKEFARMMIEDHGQFGQKLAIFSGPMTGTEGRNDGTRTGGTDGKNDGGTRQPNPGESKGGAGGDPRNSGMPLDTANLVRELGRKCLESAKQALSEKQGSDFDKCYMHMQVMAHQKVADSIEVFGNHASPKLKATLDEGEKTVKTHLEYAKQICKKIDGEKETARK